ncbi:hypothetical protein EDF66_101686 [Sphingobacterium sp. JUb20]|nr:hypothetical protein EDF66_101686 [Sphingobacterium sp. JUb20]
MLIIKICSENYTYLKTQPPSSNHSPIKVWNLRFTLSNQYYRLIFMKELKIILKISLDIIVIIKICPENYTFIKTQPSSSNHSPIKIWNKGFISQ